MTGGYEPLTLRENNKALQHGPEYDPPEDVAAEYRALGFLTDDDIDDDERTKTNDNNNNSNDSNNSNDDNNNNDGDDNNNSNDDNDNRNDSNNSNDDNIGTAATAATATTSYQYWKTFESTKNKQIADKELGKRNRHRPATFENSARRVIKRKHGNKG
jgi:hypothetical protein